MSQSNLIEHELCHVDEMENNTMKEFEIKIDESSFKVLLIKYENNFSCLAAKCSHYQVPLQMGVLYKGRVRCAAHGACFDIKTGDIEDYPGLDCIPSYNVHVKNGIVFIKTSKKELENTKRQKTHTTQISVEKSGNNLNNEISKVIISDRSIRVGSASRTIERPKTSRIINRPGSANTAAQAEKQSAKLLPKCVIIGSGAAGLLCLDTFREFGYGSNVTMITKDSYPPYDRVKLSKALDSKINSICLRDNEFMARNNLNFHMNQEVDKIDFENKKVICKSGMDFEYDKLVIATGLRSIGMPNTLGNNLKGIFTLRCLEDSNNLMKYFEQLKKENSSNKLNVVLIGTSFISMEVASYFHDKANTFVMGFRKPFETIFGEQVASKIKKMHESKGVKFLIDQKFNVEKFKESSQRPGHLGEIKLKDGSQHLADICVIAIGGIPVTDFLKNSNTVKLSEKNFIIVDKNMKTSVDDVYAAGDITYFPRSCLPGFDHLTELEYLNIGHWGLASSQGRIAALSIVNSNRTEQLSNILKTVPFFWSTQYNMPIRFAGLSHNYDSIIFHEDPAKQNPFKFAAFYLKSNIVIGVASFDWGSITAVFAEAMQNNIEIKRENVENDSFDLKKLLI